VSAPSLPLTEKLGQSLSALCAQPTGTGHIADLRSGAEAVAAQLRSIGMHVRVIPTAGAPVVVGQLGGRAARTLLLYHHYDTTSPGPWREWSHEPLQLAERSGIFYARGVVSGKGPLAAHIQSLHSLIRADGGLPCGVTIIAEGHGMSGSQHLDKALATHADTLRADACLASQGERDIHGRPLCYSGTKGHLQVRLHARSGAYPLPASLAPSLRNPLWRLSWALTCIKGDDEDIKIGGFYDNVEGPTRAENTLLRQIEIDEGTRLRAWQRKEFLFGMSGPALVRAEATLPTCNLSAITCDPAGDTARIPAAAEATLDFQLVPNQRPEAIFAQLQAHLIERGFADIAVERLPGGYPPAVTPHDAPFIHMVSTTGTAVYGAPLNMAPAGPLALPLQLFIQRLGLPAASVGVARPDSAIHGPDERIPIEDLARHAQLLGEVLAAFAG
jgi:acetylornithine deacetylase/succinyl-diaminopimelate desuccinylase-like protein